MITQTGSTSRRTFRSLALSLLYAGGLLAAAAGTPAAHASIARNFVHPAPSSQPWSAPSVLGPVKHTTTHSICNTVHSGGNSTIHRAINPQPLPPGGAE